MFTINRSKVKKGRYDYFIIGINERVNKTFLNGNSITLSKSDNSLLVDEDTDFNDEGIVSFFKENFLNYREVIEFISNKIKPQPFTTIF